MRELLERFAEDIRSETRAAEFRETLGTFAEDLLQAFELYRRHLTLTRATYQVQCEPARLARDKEACRVLVEETRRDGFPEVADHYAQVLGRHRAAYRAPLRLVRS